MPTIFFLLPSPSQTKYFHFPNIFLSFLLPSDLRPHISLSVLRSNLCLLFLPGLIPNVFLRQIISSFIKRPNDFPQKIPLPFLPRLLLEPLNLLHYKMSYVQKFSFRICNAWPLVFLANPPQTNWRRSDFIEIFCTGHVPSGTQIIGSIPEGGQKAHNYTFAPEPVIYPNSYKS